MKISCGLEIPERETVSLDLPSTPQSAPREQACQDIGKNVEPQTRGTLRALLAEEVAKDFNSVALSKAPDRMAHDWEAEYALRKVTVRVCPCRTLATSAGRKDTRQAPLGNPTLG